jgi:hypothetical protein
VLASCDVSIASMHRTWFSVRPAATFVVSVSNFGLENLDLAF